MTKKFLLYISALVLIIGNNFSQTGHYTPLQSVGKPPLSLLKTIKESVKDNELVLSPYEPKNTRLLEYSLNGTSYYQINEMFQSGNIIYGEDIHEYLSKLLEAIQKKNRIHSNLNIFPFKSSYTNAFATDIGYLFVNIGLISRVSSEAELAFVICHELAHYTLRHNLEGQLTELKQEQSSKKKAITAYDKLVQKHRYSQNFELQADSLGMVYYIAAGYNPELIENVFTILSDEHYIQNKEVDINQFFNYDKQLAIYPEDLIRDAEGKFIVQEEIFNGKFSTHPKIEDRIKRIEANKPKKSRGKSSIVTRKLFTKAQKTSLLENLRIALLEENYLDAIYYSIEIYNNSTYKEYARTGFIRANIGLFLSKIYDPNINPRFYYERGLLDQKIEKESVFIPILNYFRLTSNQKLAKDIVELLNDGIKEFPDSEELKALNNWFTDWMEQEASVEITNFKPIELEKTNISSPNFDYSKRLFVDPNIAVVDMRGKPSVDFIKSEKIKIKTSKYAEKTSTKNEKLVYMGFSNRKTFTTDNFNNTGLINTRIREIFDSPLVNKVPPIDYYVLKELCTKMNTERTTFTTGIIKRDLRSPLSSLFLYYFIVTAPIAIIVENTPKSYTDITYYDIDLIQGTYSDSYDMIFPGKFGDSQFKKIYTPR